LGKFEQNLDVREGKKKRKGGELCQNNDDEFVVQGVNKLSFVFIIS
jgi:hypothetical protein